MDSGIFLYSIKRIYERKEGNDDWEIPVVISSFSYLSDLPNRGKK